MKIRFHADLNHTQAGVVWRCRGELAKLGIELSQDGPCDLRLVHSPVWEDDFLLHPEPVVVLERIDGAQLSSRVRRFLWHRNLSAVIKNCVYRDWMRYNRQCWRGHEWACRRAMGEVEGDEPLLPREKWISEEQYQKLHVGFSFAAYEPLVPLRRPMELLASADRKYDMHFAGTTNYPGESAPWLDWHRQQCAAAIRKVPGDHFVCEGRSMPRDGYWETLKQSRFVVSPWGLGEACWRDFEAILCGCIVIKPDTTYMETSPTAFYEWGCLRRCSPDFSDLTDVIARYEEMSGPGSDLARDRWPVDRILHQSSDPEIALRLADVFYSVVGKREEAAA